MKKLISAAAAAIVTAASIGVAAPSVTYADNPCIQTIYSTDPAPMVYDDTVYLYTGSDKPNSSFYYMPDWHCYSTKDMQNWTDHGTILSWDSFTWGKEDSAWAAQCIERNGKFYYYVTLDSKSGGGRAIGVAVADSPTGPFKDALGKPLCGPNWDYIDPTVWIDDDGQAYLMFGNPTCYYVKLNEDMISYSGRIEKFDMNPSSFGPNTTKASSYGEGPWFYKRNNLYYLVYAAFYGGDGGESLGYSTAPTPTGPWTYGGQVMKPYNCYTNHPGVIDFAGRSYLFYHDASLPGGGTFDRSVCVEEFSYNADGSIPTISPSKSGPEQLQCIDPFERVEAETICYTGGKDNRTAGVKTEKCSEGGMNVSNVTDGSYIKVKGVDFGQGADKFTASVAANGSGGTIELHTDEKNGTLIGTCQVGGTGGWQNWQEVSCDVDVEGEHDLFLVFKGSGDYIMNVDWWQFDGAGSSDTDSDGYIFHSTFEGKTDSWTGRGGASVTASTDEAYEGTGSAYVSDRTATWQGVSRALSSKFKAGESYSFSANVKYTDGAPTTTFHFTLQYDDANGEAQYVKIDTQTVNKGEWTQLANTSFRIPEGARKPYIYVETEGDGAEIDFYVDEIAAAADGTEIPGAGANRPAENLILGDINYDGKVDSFDVIRGRQVLIAAADDSTNIASNILRAADIDRSGDYHINDLIHLSNFVLGKTKTLGDTPINA